MNQFKCAQTTQVHTHKHTHLCVHAALEVCAVHAHGLLAHGTLVRVTRRLVVVGEGNDGGTHTQDHGRVDLTVGVGGGVRALRV